jgi:muconate cycloisomerase
MEQITTNFRFSSTAAEVIEGVDLNGKRATVTGGASGIGLETAKALSAVGAAVTLAVRRPAAARVVAEDIRVSTGLHVITSVVQKNSSYRGYLAMKITSIEAIPYTLPTVRPHKLAMATITDHTLVLVRIRDDEGREGLGEAAIIPHYGAETQHGICQVISENLAPNLVGQDPMALGALLTRVDQLIKRNSYAKGAIEMACVDLAAKAAGLPADALFGGRARDRIPVLWVLGTGDARKDTEEAEEKLAQGRHNLFLVKIGHGDPLADVARAVAVKRALGDKASIRVDVNQAWDETTATRAIAGLEAGGIDAVEQPLPGANIEGMRRLTERFTVTIMADEPIETIEDAFAFARIGAADAFSLKVSKHGGLTNTRKVAAIAEAAGLSLFGGTMLESGVGTAASAQLFATLPTLSWGCQLFGPLLFKDDIAANRPEYRDFDLIVPNGPGFGVVVDEDKLAFYRRDAERRERRS